MNLKKKVLKRLMEDSGKKLLDVFLPIEERGFAEFYEEPTNREKMISLAQTIYYRLYTISDGETYCDDDIKFAMEYGKHLERVERRLKDDAKWADWEYKTIRDYIAEDDIYGFPRAAKRVILDYLPYVPDDFEEWDFGYLGSRFDQI
jgi:hypothetical protein